MKGQEKEKGFKVQGIETEIWWKGARPTLPERAQDASLASCGTVFHSRFTRCCSVPRCPSLIRASNHTLHSLSGRRIAQSPVWLYKSCQHYLQSCTASTVDCIAFARMDCWGVQVWRFLSTWDMDKYHQVVPKDCENNLSVWKRKITDDATGWLTSLTQAKTKPQAGPQTLQMPRVLPSQRCSSAGRSRTISIIPVLWMAPASFNVIACGNGAVWPSTS